MGRGLLRRRYKGWLWPGRPVGRHVRAAVPRTRHQERRALRLQGGQPGRYQGRALPSTPQWTAGKKRPRPHWHHRGPPCVRPPAQTQRRPDPGEGWGWRRRVWTSALLCDCESRHLSEAELLACAVMEQDRRHPHRPCGGLGHTVGLLAGWHHHGFALIASVSPLASHGHACQEDKFNHRKVEQGQARARGRPADAPPPQHRAPSTGRSRTSQPKALDASLWPAQGRPPLVCSQPQDGDQCPHHCLPSGGGGHGG